jgi:hypothetical protein
MPDTRRGVAAIVAAFEAILRRNPHHYKARIALAQLLLDRESEVSRMHDSVLSSRYMALLCLERRFRLAAWRCFASSGDGQEPPTSTAHPFLSR